MKKLIILFFLFSVYISAQNKDATVKKLSKETCDCMSKSDVSGMGISEIEMALGICMVKAMSNHENELKKIYGDSFSITDESIMEDLGEKIGYEMASVCPDLFVKLMNEEDLDMGNDDEDYYIMETKGKVVKIVENEFITIEVKDSNNTKHQLLYLYEIENGNLITSGNIKGKDATFYYMEMEFYDVKSKNYKTYKIVEGIEL